jgi:intein/homing endonuclease
MLTKESQILSEITTYLKYSRYNPELQRREVWDELVTRNKEMHIEKFPQLREEIENAYSFVYGKKILPSMRSLQFGGKPIEINNSRIFNCSYLPIDDYRSFSEIMFLLLSGCGVGYSVQNHHIDKLPEIRKPLKSKRYLIGDSIEGWADAVRMLMKSYFGIISWSPNFDFRDIRPKGASLITVGGKAPGPEPLKIALVHIQAILDRKENGQKLSSLECHDIICHLADAVLSGGIRRAALISLFNLDDEEMLTSKFGNWWEMNPQRGRANNSAVLLRSKIDQDTFLNLWKKIEASNSGEPGFLFTNDKDEGTNPCAEINLKPNQFCLTKDTLILTDEGYQSIEELLNKEKLPKIVSNYIDDTKTIEDKSSFSKHDFKIFPTGIKPIFEIKTHRGPSIKATSNHKFLTQDGYVAVEELDIDYHNLYMAQDNTNIKYNYIERDNFNEYDFLGWLLGDGYYTNNPNNLKNVYETLGLVFGSEEDVLAKTVLKPIFENLLQEAVDAGVTRNKNFDLKPYRDKNGVTTLVTSSTKARYIANKFGLKPGTAKDKTLPEMYWNLSMKNKSRILSALFSADGSVTDTKHRKIIQLSMSNPIFAKQVQLALTEFGISSKYTITERKHSNRCKTEVILQIGNKTNIETFKNNIGFSLHPRKQQDLDNITYQVTHHFKNHNKFCIESIEYIGEEEVFDLTVEDSHNFIANGLITHNCNLCEINASDIHTQEEYNARSKAAAFIGTLQASYTDFHYLRDVWKKTTEKEALLGIGMTGIASGAVLKLDMKQAAKVAVEENARVANLIGINKAARVTTVKPSGTTSLVLGTSSGIHAWHSEYYIRRVRLGKNESLYLYLKNNHPELIEDDYFKPNIQAIVKIPQKAPKDAITREKESALDLLERIKTINKEWIKPGHRKGSNMHNVSATVTIKPEEWDIIGDWLYSNREYFTALSFLPFSDHTYIQSPFEDITKEEFEESIKSLHSVDLTKVIEIEDNTSLQDNLACSGNNCEII